MTGQLARLPAPRTAQWDWQCSAACRGLDEAVFFSPDGERGARRKQREDQAKQVCARCPVRQTCLRYALAAEEPYGVWGGLTAPERRHYAGSQRVGEHALSACP